MGEVLKMGMIIKWIRMLILMMGLILAAGNPGRQEAKEYRTVISKNPEDRDRADKRTESADPADEKLEAEETAEENIKEENTEDQPAEETAGNTAEGEAVENKAAEEESVSDDTVSEDPVSKDSVSSGSVSEGKLPYWSGDSKACESIVEYVEAATDESSDKFIPKEDRIAVFDLDGTLIGELYPSYFEYMMFIHRALYDESYSASPEMKEFAEALEEGIKTGNMPKNNETLHAKYAGRAYAGMTIDEMKEYVREFMDSRADGFTDLTRGDAFYKPMVSLVEYLDDNDFTCYIVSGSDRAIVRALIEDKLPIPENRVIGMSYTMVATGQQGDDGLQYQYTEDDDVILGGDLIIKTIKMNKVSEIALEIGKVPVLAFGNSSGDLSMAQYTVNNDEYEGRAYLVLCDDLEREHGNMDKADSLAKTCAESGFETISMRDDFGTIYGDEVKITDYEYNEADALNASGSDRNEENDGEKEEDSEEKDESDNEDNGESGSKDKAASVKDGFTEDEYPVYKGKLTDEKIKIRYYDAAPDVPYVGIKAYYDCIAKESLDSGHETMTVVKETDGTYSLKSAHGEAKADIEKNTLSSDDLSGFTNIMCLVQAGMGNGYCDGLPFVRVKEMRSEGNNKATLDLGKYDIDIYGDENDVYFPVSTLSDIFSDLMYHYSVFNGETFYFNNDMDSDTIAEIDPDYAKPMLESLGDDFKRPQDMVDFTYNELCFSVDSFYGLPGKSLINDELEAYGIERALKEYGEPGEKTIELLKSDDYAEYLCGAEYLNYFLNDGGHTLLKIADFGSADTEKLEERMDEIKDELDPLFAQVIDASDKVQERRKTGKARKKVREESYGDEKYIKEGDTAVFVLDSFMDYDTEGWDKYYKNDGLLPSAENDDIIRLKEALEDVEEDDEVENLVIDISNNGGGSLDEVAIFLGLITGKREVEFTWDNTLTGAKITEIYEMDNNFDRKFDEKDEMDPVRVNVSVLTSFYSFSCGNVFPSVMKSEGYMIMGEQSGGGACAVMTQTTGDGLTYRFSSYKARITDIEGKNIDGGVPVDVDLIPKRSDGNNKKVTVRDVDIDGDSVPEDALISDYSAFYEIERLSEEMERFYNKAS